MKTHPTTQGAPKKTKYRVEIDGEVFITWAPNEELALSNAAYRFADQEDLEVRLVMWKLRNDKLDYSVEEV